MTAGNPTQAEYPTREAADGVAPAAATRLVVVGVLGVAGALVATLQGFSFAAGGGLRWPFVVFLVLIQGLASLETSDLARLSGIDRPLRTILALLALAPGVSLVVPAVLSWVIGSRSLDPENSGSDRNHLTRSG